MVLMLITRTFKKPRSAVAAFFWQLLAKGMLSKREEVLNNGSFSGAEGTSTGGNG